MYVKCPLSFNQSTWSLGFFFYNNSICESNTFDSWLKTTRGMHLILTKNMIFCIDLRFCLTTVLYLWCVCVNVNIIEIFWPYLWWKMSHKNCNFIILLWLLQKQQQQTIINLVFFSNYLNIGKKLFYPFNLKKHNDWQLKPTWNMIIKTTKFICICPVFV